MPFLKPEQVPELAPGLPDHGSPSALLFLYPEGGAVCTQAGLPRGLRWSDAWGKSPPSEVPLPRHRLPGRRELQGFAFSRLVARRVHKCYVPGETANSS